MFSHKPKPSGKPPTYPNRLRRTVTNYKSAEQKLQEKINALSKNMGIPINEEPEIPDNMLNQLAKHNKPEVKGTKGGRRTLRRKSKEQKKKTRKH